MYSEKLLNHSSVSSPDRSVSTQTQTDESETTNLHNNNNDTNASKKQSMMTAAVSAYSTNSRDLEIVSPKINAMSTQTSSSSPYRRDSPPPLLACPTPLRKRHLGGSVSTSTDVGIGMHYDKNGDLSSPSSSSKSPPDNRSSSSHCQPCKLPAQVNIINLHINVGSIEKLQYTVINCLCRFFQNSLFYKMHSFFSLNGLLNGLKF